MEKSPLVSVVIPFYNCRYVNQAIESVLNQSYPNIEMILVNDGSTKYEELIQPYLQDIQYIEQENQGVASALNQGLQHAKGEYIAWLSSDDLFDPYKVETQLQFMLEKQADISFTKFNHIDENNDITKYNVGANFRSYLDFLHSLREFCPINGCTVMMSKEVIEKVGYFNEALKYVQDYDYWIRATLQFKLHYLNVTLTNYRVHPQMGSVLHHKQQMEEFHQVKAKYRPFIDYMISQKRNELDV